MFQENETIKNCCKRIKEFTQAQAYWNNQMICSTIGPLHNNVTHLRTPMKASFLFTKFPLNDLPQKQHIRKSQELRYNTTRCPESHRCHLEQSWVLVDPTKSTESDAMRSIELDSKKKDWCE